MNKILVFMIFIVATCSASTIKPTSTYTSTGAVVDIVVSGDKLYSATDASCVDVFDIKSNKLLKQIKVSQIKDFMDDIIDSKVYSVDVIGKKLLILSQAKKGARRLHIYENDKLELIIPYSDKLFIAKAKFINDTTVVLGLLSNEIISYDIVKKKANYRIQASQSKFSNFIMNEKKSELIVADESGDLKIFSLKSAKLIKELSGQNLDNVFQVDTKNGIIATAGQDGRVVVYDTNKNSSYYKKVHFLIYGVGLSPSGKIVGFAKDENNNVALFNSSSKSNIGLYGGNKMTITNILFLNEKEFLVASDDKTINYYKIK